MEEKCENCKNFRLTMRIGVAPEYLSGVCMTSPPIFKDFGSLYTVYHSDVAKDSWCRKFHAKGEAQ